MNVVDDGEGPWFQMHSTWGWNQLVRDCGQQMEGPCGQAAHGAGSRGGGAENSLGLSTLASGLAFETVENLGKQPFQRVTY